MNRPYKLHICIYIYLFIFIESGSVSITLSSADKETGRGGVINNSKRVNKISSGGIFGEAAFFLDLPHSVRCVTNGFCVLWSLDRYTYMCIYICLRYIVFIYICAYVYWTSPNYVDCFNKFD
jgi:hypothetical protein